jgi:protein-S-isoprenylcysteine O-methyltransferase Ste14
MAGGTVLVVAIQLPFITMQLLRSRYEEHLLREVFPRYAAYAAATPRIVPIL